MRVLLQVHWWYCYKYNEGIVTSTMMVLLQVHWWYCYKYNEGIVTSDGNCYNAVTGGGRWSPPPKQKGRTFDVWLCSRFLSPLFTSCSPTRFPNFPVSLILDLVGSITLVPSGCLAGGILVCILILLNTLGIRVFSATVLFELDQIKSKSNQISSHQIKPNLTPRNNYFVAADLILFNPPNKYCLNFHGYDCSWRTVSLKKKNPRHLR